MGSDVRRPCTSLGSGAGQPCDLDKLQDVSAFKNEDDNLDLRLVPMIKRDNECESVLQTGECYSNAA